MTRPEANKAGMHYSCGGTLYVQQRHIKGTMWEVSVQCQKCGKGMISKGPYRRPLEGEEAIQDRQQRAIKEFNEGAPWEQPDEWGR